MSNLDRFYKPVSIATVATPNDLSDATKTANTAAINTLWASLAGTGVACYIPPGTWGFNGHLNNPGCTVFGEGPTSILYGDDGTSVPACIVYLSGSSPEMRYLKIAIAGTVAVRGGARGAIRAGYVNGVLAPTSGHIVDHVEETCLQGFGLIAVAVGYGRTTYNDIHDTGTDALGHYNGSHDCEVGWCTVNRAGDDMFSVVSINGALNAAVQCSNILEHDCTGTDMIQDTDTGIFAGGGLKVGGGTNITFRNMRCTRMNQNFIGVLAASMNNTYNDGVLFDDCHGDTTGMAGAPYTFGAWGGLFYGDHAANYTNNVVVRNSTFRKFPTDSLNKGGFAKIGFGTPPDATFTTNIDLSGFSAITEGGIVAHASASGDLTTDHYFTMDGYSGWSQPWTADGWPEGGSPWTADGWIVGDIIGEADAAAAASGDLTTHIKLAGGAVSAAVASAGLRPLAGAAHAAAAATAALTAKIKLSGVASSRSVAGAEGLTSGKKQALQGGGITQSRARGELTTIEAPPPLPNAPAEDVDLDAILQETVRGICNLPGDLVRPRWQPIMSKQPEADVDWAAIGVTNITADPGPAIVHNPLGQGTDYYIRHEDIDALVSFYGPHSQMMATRFRDGIAVPQNTEPLAEVAVRWIECGSIRQAPDLINTKWIRRQDMTLRFRRKVTRVYGIESLLIADVHGFDDTTVDFTVVVPPHANLEP